MLLFQAFMCFLIVGYQRQLRTTEALFPAFVAMAIGVGGILRLGQDRVERLLSSDQKLVAAVASSMTATKAPSVLWFGWVPICTTSTAVAAVILVAMGIAPAYGFVIFIVGLMAAYVVSLLQMKSIWKRAQAAASGVVEAEDSCATAVEDEGVR